MKLIVQTLTGEKTEVTVKQSSTVKQLKLAILKSGKIRGAVRILKNTKSLEDGSTLTEHNIQHGDTINIAIEPEKEIEVEVKCGPFHYKHKVSPSMTIIDLKNLLIEKKEVAFLRREFQLVCSQGPYSGKKLVSDDDSLPLHFIPKNDLKLEVEGPYLMIESIDPSGKSCFDHVDKNITVSELKVVIMKSQGVHGNNISMFVKSEENHYTKLDEKVPTPLCRILPEDKKVYFIENNGSGAPITISFGNEVFARVKAQYCVTVLNWKLHVQNRLGIPVNRIRVREPDRGRIDYSDEDKTNIGMRIEIIPPGQ